MLDYYSSYISKNFFKMNNIYIDKGMQYFKKVFNRLWNKIIIKKKKSKIRLSENQIQQIIEMSKDELELRRISNIIYTMLNEYEDIRVYIEDLHNIIDKLWLETTKLEYCLIIENIRTCKSYLKSVS